MIRIALPVLPVLAVSLAFPVFGLESPPKSSAVIPMGINDTFKSPELDVDEWIERFEVESREVYAAQNEVLKACEIKPGQRIADVGVFCLS